MRLRLLVVDDCMLSRFYHSMAVRNLGHDTVGACNGFEAIERLREYSCDGVVLDLLMPECCGVQFLERIRRDARYRHTPVIAITSDRRSSEVARVRALGADVLHKPAPGPEVAALIARRWPAPTNPRTGAAAWPRGSSTRGA